MPILRAVGRYMNDAPLAVGAQELEQTPLRRWPDSCYLGSTGGPLVGGGGVLVAEYYQFSVMFTGATGYKRLAGVTKDQTGAPLAGATCQAFRTSEDVANSLPANLPEGPATISDAAGNYECMVPNTDQHYIIAKKAGTPNIIGITDWTLVGT